MSWIFGIAGNYSKQLDFIQDYNPSFKHETLNLKLFAGGLKENIFANIIDDKSGLIAAGVGIINRGDSYGFMEPHDWKKFDEKTLHREEINGHFIFIKWNESELHFYNDIYGIRDLFFHTSDKCLFFSTRLDLLKFVIKKIEINYKEFASNWMLSIPFSHESLLQNVKRLGPGGAAHFQNNNLEVENNFWQPKTEEVNSSKFLKTIEKILIFPLINNKSLTLGLSGGLDSRFLLEILLKHKEKKWKTHSFGNIHHPDMILAKQIAEDKNLNNIFIDINKYKYENYLKILREYVGQLGFTFPAFKILMFPLHKFIAEKEPVIIDGAMGEIHRGELMRRYLYFGKSAFLKRDIKKLLNLFYSDKAEIFKDQFAAEMRNSLYDLVEGIFKVMPELKKTEYEKWLNLLVMIYKLPYIASASQAVLDSFSIAFMPYIQPDLMNISFNLEQECKKNGRLYRNFINEGSNKLNEYPLVKNTIVYPYNTSTFVSRILFYFKNKSKTVYRDNSAELFLLEMKDYIYDRINSIDFKNFDLYDQKKIGEIVDDFYSGNKTHSVYLNWFLTFEIWRETFFGK